MSRKIDIKEKQAARLKELITEFNEAKIDAVTAIEFAFRDGIKLAKSNTPRIGPSGRSAEQQEKWDLEDKRRHVENLALSLLSAPVWPMDDSEKANTPHLAIKRGIALAQYFLLEIGKQVV